MEIVRLLSLTSEKNYSLLKRDGERIQQGKFEVEGLWWVKGQRKFLQEWFEVGILGKQYWWYCCDVSRPPIFNESMTCGNRGPEPGVTRRASVWHSPAPYLTAPHSEICRNHIGGLQSLHWCGMWLMPTVSKSQILGYSSWHLDLWRKKNEADKWRNERSCALKREKMRVMRLSISWFKFLIWPDWLPAFEIPTFLYSS